MAQTKNTGYMRMSDALNRAGGAARSTGRAFRSGGRAGGRASRRTTAWVHRVTGAQGADRTGLGTLIEMTATSGAADAFVTVALAGTIFFSTSVDQARGKVVLFLIITMAPFAVLAPFIGPALDRIQQGRRFVLAGHDADPRAALLRDVGQRRRLGDAAARRVRHPRAAEGGRGREGVGHARDCCQNTSRLVTANARAGLISIIASTAAAGLAAGIQYTTDAAWTLRVGTLIYLAAMVIALRLPEQIDLPAHEPAPAGAGAGPASRPPHRALAGGRAGHPPGHAAPHAAARAGRTARRR